MANTRKDKLLYPSGSCRIIRVNDVELVRYPKPSYRIMNLLMRYFGKGYEKVDQTDPAANIEFYLQLLQIVCNSQDVGFMAEVAEKFEIPKDKREQFADNLWDVAMDGGISFNDFNRAIITDISVLITGTNPLEDVDVKVDDVENPPAVVEKL